jgi:hypothetical protein
MSEYYEQAKVCKQLPWEIRSALAKAAQVVIPRGDPLARVRAIEAAMARARQSHPHLFA